jgi:hypothetical protein
MDNSTKWRELKEEFRKLGDMDNHHDLRVYYNYKDERECVPAELKAPTFPSLEYPEITWDKVQCSSKRVRLDFCTAATRAGGYLPHSKDNLCNVWLEALRRHLISEGEKLDTGEGYEHVGNSNIYYKTGQIASLCEVSENFCAELERKALEEEELRQPSEKQRLELDEGRKRLRIDDDWHDYTGEEAGALLRALMAAKAEWQPLKCLSEVTKPSRLLNSLPEKIRAIIDTNPGQGGGVRIKPEYFDLD